MSIIINTENIDEYTTGSWPLVAEIKWNYMCPFEPSILPNFPNLQTLDCERKFYERSKDRARHNYLRLKTLSWLRYCPQLRKLVCGYNSLECLEGIKNCPNLETLDCTSCTLITLKGIENCKQLRILRCSYNRLDMLTGLGACTELRELYCTSNRLVTLMGLKNCTHIEQLICADNQLDSLQGIENCSQLKKLGCSDNRITSLVLLRGCAELRDLYCGGNQLVSLDGIDACNQLSILHCDHNRLTSLEHLVYMRHLRVLYFNDNAIAIQTAQTRRFLMRFDRTSGSSIYSDGQNVHDVTIQKSVCDSVRSLLTDPKPTFSIAMIVESGMDERAVRLLLEYCDDKTIHSVHLLTYIELLSYVWARICRSEHRLELIKILGEQIGDSECKCFTGRFNRTLSVLVGFYEDIIIEISDSSRIGAIILAVKNRLGTCDPKVHREHARKALLEARYDEATIELWLEAISEA